MRVLYTSLMLSGLVCLLPLSQTASAQNIKDIQEYCQSMAGSGMSDEDTRAFMEDCVAEQSSYMDQEMPAEEVDQLEESSTESEPQNYEEHNNYDSETYQEPQYDQEEYGQEQNCYSKVDEHIQKLLDTDPNSSFDYDQLVDQCLKGNL